MARQVREHGQPIEAPACLISGGETTVTIRGGDGRGGQVPEIRTGGCDRSPRNGRHPDPERWNRWYRRPDRRRRCNCRRRTTPELFAAGRSGRPGRKTTLIRSSKNWATSSSRVQRERMSWIFTWSCWTLSWRRPGRQLQAQPARRLVLQPARKRLAQQPKPRVP